MPEKATQDAMQGTKDSKTSPSAINMLNANAVPASDHKKHVASDSTAAIHPDSSDNRPRTTQQPSTTASVPIDLELPLAHSLKALAKEYNIHVSLILAVGWTAILSRLSGQDDILIGYYRDLANGSHTHSGSLPLRIDLSGTPNTVQLLERVRDHGSQPFATESSILVFQALLYWHDQGWASTTCRIPQHFAGLYGERHNASCCYDRHPIIRGTETSS
ncbi:hypothetical protein B0O80DRAFT_422106 [Mortierella sp. GBAus27b]|nr:hypothetical protein B0O80DRAFT_422106 [Mortierella sp. GBAus27b]